MKVAWGGAVEISIAVVDDDVTERERRCT